MSSETTPGRSWQGQSYEVRLPASRSRKVSASFVQRVRKYGASARLLRNLRDVTEDDASGMLRQGHVNQTIETLRSGADAGDRQAAIRLATLLAEHGRVDELEARANAGDGFATSLLVDLLAEQGRVSAANSPSGSQSTDLVGRGSIIESDQGPSDPSVDVANDRTLAASEEKIDQLVARLSMALSRNLTSQERQAIKSLREAGFAVEIIPDDPGSLEPIYKRALALIISGNPEEGVRLMEEIAQHDIENGETPPLRLVRTPPPRAS